jgi:hypothetical protein
MAEKRRGGEAVPYALLGKSGNYRGMELYRTAAVD